MERAGRAGSIRWRAPTPTPTPMPAHPPAAPRPALPQEVLKHVRELAKAVKQEPLAVK